MKLWFLVASLAALTACVSQPKPVTDPSGIQAANPQDVINCRSIGDVHGLSSFYGNAENALEAARFAAADKARSLGASHVVWNQASIQDGSTAISGSAYRCN